MKEIPETRDIHRVIHMMSHLTVEELHDIFVPEHYTEHGFFLLYKAAEVSIKMFDK